MRKKLKIQTREEALALAYFLKKEMYRHQDDIQAIIKDIFAIKKRWGIDWQDVVIKDRDEFVEV